MNATTAQLERWAALQQRVTVLERALEKISAISSNYATRDLREIDVIAQKALRG